MNRTRTTPEGSKHFILQTKLRLSGRTDRTYDPLRFNGQTLLPAELGGKILELATSIPHRGETPNNYYWRLGLTTLFEMGTGVTALAIVTR